MASPITKRARELRNGSTNAEKALWKALKENFPHMRFRRQYPVGPYFADIVCKDQKLIIEVDGGQHDLASATEQKRTDFLKDNGYRVLRFWNNDVLGNIEGIMVEIAKMLNTPPLTPPLAGGDLSEDI